MDWYATYIPDPYAQDNRYKGISPQEVDLPTFQDALPLLPVPIWSGRQAALDCYWKVWELAFRNLRRPTPENAFVSPIIDTAHNGNLFMWDSAFIMMFARYGRRAFDFQATLDNFYAKQHPDGYTCREIRETDGSDCFKRFDPPATGPELLPWSEWEYYLLSGDRARLAKVFPPLMAFHRWMRHYRTWQDGSYWATGWACGMDNQPRLSKHIHSTGRSPDGPPEWWDHDHMTWVDACFQALLSARMLKHMAAELGREDEAQALGAEAAELAKLIEQTLWDEAAGFYFDRRASGALSTVKSIASFWGLLTGGLSSERVRRLTSHLEDPQEFNRPHRVPSLAADHPDYSPLGSYWRGGVWCPTTYMVLAGLCESGFGDLAYAIALNHHENVLKVFERTGTVWENYAPELAQRGNQASPDFVGWSGLAPVAVLFEFLFGLRAIAPQHILRWDVRLLEEHGVLRYPFGQDGCVDLHCAARRSAQEKPRITVQTNRPLTVQLTWKSGSEALQFA